MSVNRLYTDAELDALRTMPKRVDNPRSRWSEDRTECPARPPEVAPMNLDTGALQRLLCERLCEDVRLAERPDGALMLHTHFEFPDGDRFPIHVSWAGAGGVRLSDRGHTLMHVSYDHDIDSFLAGTRGQMLERIVGEAGIEQDGGTFRLDTPIEKLPEAIFRFGQALTRVYDLTLPSRSRVRSASYPGAERRSRPEAPSTDRVKVNSNAD